MTVELVGEALREARRALGLTQRQLADELGVTASAVGQWENGTTRPAWQQMRRLDEIFGQEAAAFEIGVAVGQIEGQLSVVQAQLAVALTRIAALEGAVAELVRSQEPMLLRIEMGVDDEIREGRASTPGARRSS